MRRTQIRVCRLVSFAYFHETLCNIVSETTRATIDKAAASRFIKHAITQTKLGRPPGDINTEATPSSDIRVPVKVTAKMMERSKYEQELKEAGSEEEEDLQIFNENSEEGQAEDENEGEEVVEEVKPSKGKGKQKAEEDSLVGVKRKRSRMDPFAGYGDDIDTSTVTAKKNKTAASLNNERNVSTDLSQNNSGRSTPLSSTSISKKEAKAAKKAKRKSRPLSP